MFLRKLELRILEQCFLRSGADLVVVYGRRRLGKTTLILNFLERHKGVYLYTPRGKIEDVLDTYSKALAEQLSLDFFGAMRGFSEFLDVLYKLAMKKRLVVVIDEFQRLQEADESSISLLQDYWDRKLRFTNIKLVLVGSLIGVVERLALAGDAPLFGRPTLKLKIEPLPYYRARKFWRALSPVERVFAYGVFGGTPAYMDSYDFSVDIWGNVERVIVRKEGKLNGEPEVLLASELRNPIIYMSVLDRISMGERGLPLGKIRVGNFNVLPYINRLEKMDILERLYPLNEPRRGALYVFKDEFFRFWFRYIRRYYWLVEMGRYDLVMENIRSDINNYLSYTYEKILRELIVLLSGKEVMGVRIPRLKKFGPYWEKDLEVDALGIGGQEVVVGEAKWQDRKIGLKEIGRTIQKAERLAEKFKKKKYIVVIASKEGFKKEYQEENLILLSQDKIEQLLDKISEPENLSYT